MARGAESSGAAGKHQEVFRGSVGTADAGKSAAWVAAVQIALDDLFDGRPEITVLPLEPALVLGQKLVKIMKELR